MKSGMQRETLRALLTPLLIRGETDPGLSMVDRWLAEHDRGTDGVASVHRSGRRVVVLAGPTSGYDMACYVWKAPLAPPSGAPTACVVLSGYVRPSLLMYFWLSLPLGFACALAAAATALTTPTERLMLLALMAGVLLIFWGPLFTSNASRKRAAVIRLVGDLLPSPS